MNHRLRTWTSYFPPDQVDTQHNLVFRVLSFNCLADYLVKKDTSIPAEESWKYIWMYRRMKLLAEILHWQAGIVCLQEVDHFDDFFQPQLAKHGYVGFYKRRTGESTRDGCAIFVHKKSFRVITTLALEFHIANHPILDRDNVALHVVVECTVTHQRFIVSNTHLLYNPSRGEIKLAQAERLLVELAHMSSKKHHHGRALPVVLCGDFNMTPHSALYEYFSRQILDASGLSRHLISGQNIPPPKEPKKPFIKTEQPELKKPDQLNHAGHGVSFGRFDPTKAERKDFSVFSSYSTFRHELQLASAYAQNPTKACTGESRFTTFHRGFKGTVDYIWYTSNNIKCLGVAEMYSPAYLFRKQSLPDEDNSSDHMSLVADFSISMQ